MKYLIVLIMCLLATVKVSFQSAFGKRFGGTFLDSAIFNTAVFASGALTFVWATEDVSPILWLYATLFALCTVIFQLSYTKALAIGMAAAPTAQAAMSARLFPHRQLRLPGQSFRIVAPDTP